MTECVLRLGQPRRTSTGLSGMKIYFGIKNCIHFKQRLRLVGGGGGGVNRASHVLMSLLNGVSYVNICECSLSKSHEVPPL